MQYVVLEEAMFRRRTEWSVLEKAMFRRRTECSMLSWKKQCFVGGRSAVVLERGCSPMR